MEMLLFFLVLAAGFYLAWNIGANDVANAMGTSVGSQALTLRQAIYIAAILEFGGAFFFGSHVSQTLQNGIIQVELFAGTPEVLLLGMIASLIGTGLWLQFASYFGWPVSTTHTIVGSIIGFGLLVGGSEAINFSYVASIVSSWIISPLAGGLLGYLIFQLIRTHIFHAPHPLAAAIRILPFFIGFIAAFFSLFLMLEVLRVEWEWFEISLIMIGVALFSFLTSGVIIRKFAPLPSMDVSKTSPNLAAQLEAAREQLRETRLVSKPLSVHNKEMMIHELEGTIAALENPDAYNTATAEFNQIEKIFGWLQIFSACMMAFAHGANDVANAIGPLSASIHILATGMVPVETTVPSWALALGGVGIVVGLATWGWRVIETIGKKLTELTPTRGFSAEFGAATTILVASRLGMPISTTHTLVGAVIGIGMARGIEALNLSLMRDIATSWLVTLPAGAIMTCLVYFLLAYFFL